jgi:hypothetical protein
VDTITDLAELEELEEERDDDRPDTTQLKEISRAAW